jgi:hypothetical protein
MYFCCVANPQPECIFQVKVVCFDTCAEVCTVTNQIKQMAWEYDGDGDYQLQMASMCRIILCTQMKMLNSLYCQPIVVWKVIMG